MSDGIPVGKIVWVGRVLSTLIGLLLVMSGVGKLVGGTQLEEGFAHLGLPMSMRIPLAILEISVALVYLVPATSVVGAVLVAGYMGGAMLTHWRIGEIFVPQTAIALVAWLGLFLREPRLKSLIPLRKGGNPATAA